MSLSDQWQERHSPRLGVQNQCAIAVLSAHSASEIDILQHDMEQLWDTHQTEALYTRGWETLR
ncbi:protein of unknown function [Serratia sp. Tan611]|nr:protein of unknown function [Serratia sp. Tan611]